MEKPFDDICDNLKRVRLSIGEACVKAGRKPEDVLLLGVTKTVPPDRINAAIAAGLERIGENRVQEFLAKKDGLHLSGVEKHLIGHLQTNKVSKIVGEVDMIESVDSVHLAQAVGEASLKRQRTTDVLVEVNIGREEAKSGVLPERLEELLNSIRGFSGIRVRGLMTVAPILDTEREKRTVFSQMYKLFIDIKEKNIDNVAMDVLSMGMSSDYPEAVAEGSTNVRIGSAIFGRRHYQ